MPAKNISPRRHTGMIVFVLSLVALTVATIATRFSAQLGPDDGGGDSSSSSSVSTPYRECSSRGTIFENVGNLDRAQQLFVSRMSAVTEERENILTDTSNWSCTASVAAPMPVLRSLAEELPAWHYRRSNIFSGLFGFGYTTELRPVTFESFGSIVGEFLRVYECKVSELQSQTHTVVSTNNDYPPGTEFCCTNNGCVVASLAGDQCTGPTTTSPSCDDQCPLPDLSVYDLARRPTAFSDRALPERARARIATERTLNALHSYELEHETIRQLECAARASLDLMNSTSLLSEAMSCMPKIWDVSTSLHDRNPISPLSP